MTFIEIIEQDKKRKEHNVLQNSNTNGSFFSFEIEQKSKTILNVEVADQLDKNYKISILRKCSFWIVLFSSK